MTETKTAKRKEQEGSQESRPPSIAQVICEKLDAESAYEFFPNEDGKPYVTYTAGGKQQRTFSVGSADFRNLISRIAWVELKKKTLTKTAKDQITEHATQLAMFDGEAERPKQKVHLRVARHGDTVYYDRTADDYSIWKITPKGRSILRGDVPVKFARGALSEPMIEPAPTGQGNFHDMQKLINLDDENLALLAVYMMCSMYETTEYPILSLGGPYQSGKTTMSRFLKRILDPTDPTERAFPSEGKEVWIKAQTEHIVAFGDVDKNPSPKVSEALRQIATGGGTHTRELFTTFGDARISACRPILLNSIADFMSRQDVASRAIFINLPRRDDVDITGDELEAKFQKYAPSILGALFDAMSIALGNPARASIVNNKFRFGSGLKIAIAAEERLGFAPGTLFHAVNDNLVKRQRDMILESNVFQILQTVIDRRRGDLKLPWDEFLAMVSLNASSAMGVPKTSRGWKNWLSANEEVLIGEVNIAFRFPEKVQSKAGGSRKAGIELRQEKQEPNLRLVEEGPF